MSRGCCTFRQRDVTAAVKAVAAAGVNVVRVEVDREGKIVIVTGKPTEATPIEQRNEWDEVLDDEAS